jgi:hypothetical protein
MTTIQLDSIDALQTDLLKPYQIPDGFYDRFCALTWNPPMSAYTSNAGFGVNVLSPVSFPPEPYLSTTNDDVYRQGVVIDGDYDFILRAIALPSNVCGKFQLYTPGMSQVFRTPITVPPQGNIQPLKIIPVIPEIVYPAKGQIVFDLIDYNMSAFAGSGAPAVRCATNNIQYNAATSNPVRMYTGQVVFYGVKRYRGNLRNPAITPYDYTEKPYQYKIEFNHNFSQFTAAAGPVVTYNSAPKTFTTQIVNYPFELRQISFVLPDPANYAFTSPGAGTWGGVESGDFDTFRMQLYDAANNPMSTGSNNAIGTGAAANNNGMNPEFWAYQITTTAAGIAQIRNVTLPCPPVLYPQDSQIRIDILSLLGILNPAVTNNVTVVFNGVQRMPCR